MKKRVGRSLLSLALALVMAFSVLPVTAQAACISYAVTGGNLYFNESTGTIIDCDDTVTEAVIPAKIGSVDVTCIGPSAFVDCTSLTSVTIPSSITTIGDTAFNNCSSLTSIVIPDSVTSIGNAPFQGCTSLTSITLSGGVGTARRDLFGYTPSLTTIVLRDGVTSIGDKAFAYLANLTSITIPDSVTTIGELPFHFCSNLETVSIPGSLGTLHSGVFANSSVKNVILRNGLTSIGKEAFRETNLTSVTIPGSVQEISESAFAECSRLTSVTISEGVTSIGEYAFIYDSALTSIIIPNSVTSIGEVAFAHTGLTSVVIPEKVTMIEQFTFDSCTNLTTVTIPASVTRIANQAFQNCNISTVYYGGTAADADTLAENIGWKSGIAGNSVQWITADGRTITVLERAEEDNADYPFDPLDPWADVLTLDPYTIATQDVPESDSIPHAHTDADGDGFCDADGECLHTKSEGGYCTVDDCAHDADCTCGGPAPAVPVGPPAAGDSDPAASDTAGSTDETTSGQEDDSIPEVETTLPGGEAAPPPEEEIISPIQDIVKDAAPDEDYVDWIERIDAPEYASNLYDVLSAGADSTGDGLASCLVEDDYFVVDQDTPQGAPRYDVDEVEEVAFSLSDLYGNDVPVADSTAFEDDSFYAVGVSDSDRAVDYASLQMGDVVRTANFNGVFVVKVPKEDDFDTVKKDTAAYIGTVYHAFDRDHPEVFWLSGTCKVRIMTVKDPVSGGKEAYFFLALADKDGFTMRSPDWTAPGAVAAGIARRDEAVSRILSAVTGTTAEAQIRAFNRILTEQNEYNTTPDLTTIGNEPHECLSALEGRIGRNGPVCDGYSRAFKVLCDKLEIPCVLENGYAKPTADSAGSLHMWNAVQLGGNWYGTDVTWNDPVVKNITGAKSGYENEQFLLVGSSTEIRGMTFDHSHPVTNRAAQGGVAFDNGPTLSALAFDPSSVTEAPGKSDTGLPFTDVSGGDWFAGPVAYVYERGLMNGAGASTFQPNGNITRQQLWMVLARLGGERPGGMEEARQWAVNSGVSDGSDPAGNLTRQQLVTSLYRYCGLKGYDLDHSASLSDFPDGGSVAGYAQEAMAWAVGGGIVLGDSQGALAPDGTATRAQFATILQRFCEQIGA